MALGDDAIEWIEHNAKGDALDDWQRRMVLTLYGLPIIADRAVPDDQMYVLGGKTIVVQLVDPPVAPGQVVCGFSHAELPCSRCRAEL